MSLQSHDAFKVNFLVENHIHYICNKGSELEMSSKVNNSHEANHLIAFIKGLGDRIVK